MSALQDNNCFQTQPQNHRIGQKREIRELHIKPDWLLVYIIEDEQLILTLIQTGSHADLFDHIQQF